MKQLFLLAAFAAMAALTPAAGQTSSPLMSDLAAAHDEDVATLEVEEQRKVSLRLDVR